jgi:type IX secretion system PorP/SprF family membrane protein
MDTSMKRSLLIILPLTFTLITSVFGQSRKYISQFSHLQQYYNPGLAGYEGSIFRGFIRNQWAGWEGAPMTYFISAELDFGHVGKESDPSVMGKNAASLSMFQDNYGAFTERELIIGYAARIRVSEKTNVRLGAGVNNYFARLDPSRMTTEQANDPIVNQYLGGFADMRILDFNLGIALTNENYYVSYALHNVNKGGIRGGEVFIDKKPVVSILQAGFRNKLSDNFSIASNFMWRVQNDLPANVEFNLKALLKEKFWVGAGHRVSYANNFQFGFLMNKVRIGYIYELPLMKSYLLPNTTHEFMITYALFGSGKGMIW